MWTLAEVCRELFVTPRPVLCLDTCELLMSIQSLKDDRIQYVQAIQAAAICLTTNPNQLAVCVTDLVHLEWEQNRDRVATEATKYLETIDSGSRRIEEIERILQIQRTNPFSQHASGPLVNRLKQLGEQLRRQSISIQESIICVQRAMDRVRNKRRPSHKSMIKDSIHLEHYLELARMLKTGDYRFPCIFVSENKDDFWATSGQKNYTPRPHPDLATEMQAAGLDFSGDLVSALGLAGVIL